jgi:hypothetical protein
MNSETTTYEGKLPIALEKYRNMLCDYSYEEDGYFLYLKAGQRREQNDLVHYVTGESIAEVHEAFTWVVLCDCDGCKKYLAL